MKAYTVKSCFLAGVLAICGSTSAFAWSKPDVQVITVTDTTEAGAALPAPSRQQPIYYEVVDAGFRDFGGIMAGDKIPPRARMNRMIVSVLAKHGILPAREGHPASVVLFWTWGTMNVKRGFATASRIATVDEYGDTIVLEDSLPPQLNAARMFRFLGGNKFAAKGTVTNLDPENRDLEPGLVVLDADASVLADVAKDDIFVVAISAYDRAMLKQEKKQVLLWTTKISCPSPGLQMDETLPTMLAIAGPNIGRPTERPVWINASDKYKPQINIGEAIVVPDVVDSAPAGPSAR